MNTIKTYSNGMPIRVEKRDKKTIVVSIGPESNDVKRVFKFGPPEYPHFYSAYANAQAFIDGVTSCLTILSRTHRDSAESKAHVLPMAELLEEQRKHDRMLEERARERARQKARDEAEAARQKELKQKRVNYGKTAKKASTRAAAKKEEKEL